jgi:hypothetical protein
MNVSGLHKPQLLKLMRTSFSPPRCVVSFGVLSVILQNTAELQLQQNCQLLITSDKTGNMGPVVPLTRPIIRPIIVMKKYESRIRYKKKQTNKASDGEKDNRRCISGHSLNEFAGLHKIMSLKDTE